MAIGDSVSKAANSYGNFTARRRNEPRIDSTAMSAGSLHGR